MAAEDLPPDLTTTLTSLTAAIRSVPGWPLDKRETFTAFVLMGLASRLQPVASTKGPDQERLVELARSLGAMAARSDDEPSGKK